MFDVAWASAEKCVIRISSRSRWTWADLSRANEEVEHLLDSVDYEVGIIVTVASDATYVPPNLVENISHILQTAHPRAGLVVIVSNSRLLYIMFGLVERLLPESLTRNCHFVDTEAEAWSMLEARYALPVS